MAGFDAVEYLSFRLYPSKAMNKARAEISDGRIKEAAEEYVRGADIFEKAVQALSAESLKALVDDEKELEAKELQTRAQGQDSTRFFHRSGAAADFQQWVGRSNWSLDEAVALILGKDPNVVTWDRIKPLTRQSDFAERFADIREHLCKAQRSGQLVDPIRPDHFYRWAKAKGVTVPAKLEVLIDTGENNPESSGNHESSSHEMPSGKGPNKSAESGPAVTTPGKAPPKNSGRAAAEAAELSENVIHLGREEARLKAMRHRARVQQDVAETALPEPADDAATSLRKMVLAMAVGRYGYHPEKGGQSAITDICNDLQAAGIDMSQDTVREMLEQATTCQPGAADVA